ncbi:MAG: hypothetical protein CVT92_04325 [Bacteroidetes bacterium HGW-Bacteroidetes-1]|jgi:hypothetical protein|nr:MAG: hypothetical protein CVT92_04325 [Bacteroidetes bacterium HGW-Bacteroidetes-1]
MKNYLIFITFLGLFLIGIPKIADAAEPCTVKKIVCASGVIHYAIICDAYDEITWSDLLCGSVDE